MMADAAQLLTIQFLDWVARRPRNYGDVKEAWRSTCPRLCAWEDAIDLGLVAFAPPGERVGDRTGVVLTPRGRALLAAHL
jgi:hypothetical protein